MSGELDLDQLLSGITPTLVAGEFVFATFEDAGYGDRAELEPIASFTEREGLTLVVPRAKAEEHALAQELVFRCITLNVHSSLHGVGLTAVVAQTLADSGISANVIAGHFHDHVFVPSHRADEAAAALRALGE